jgi:hypothetical protein
VLNGRPAVFLSCSEQFKRDVAMVVRSALEDIGVHGIIVSEEPLLPRTGWTPDDKVESYLDASDAVVALCTADNHLADGTVECRQNVVDEIQRARGKTHLRDKILVLKAASVRLPSNISPTYEHLNLGDLQPATDLVVRQLRTWGVVAATVPTPAPPRPVPAIPINRFISEIGLGDHDKATSIAYQLSLDTTRDKQLQAVTELLDRLRAPIRDDDIHVLGTVLEAWPVSTIRLSRPKRSRSCP